MKNQNNGDLMSCDGACIKTTGTKAAYPTGQMNQFNQTPFTMGLRKFKTPIEKAQEKPQSLRLAINAKCFDCVGSGFDPNPCAEIRNCLMRGCPLWQVRPYQKKKPVPVAKPNTGTFHFDNDEVTKI